MRKSVLITAVSGTGKSTVCKALRAIGYNAVDIESVEGLYELANEKGREILNFLPGKAATRPWPPVLFSDEGVRQAAKMLHTYHDLVENFFPSADAEWRAGR